MENERDEHGNPICPVCKTVIKAGESVMREGNRVIHLRCVDQPTSRKP